MNVRGESKRRFTRALAAGEWPPAAALFHFATRDPRYLKDPLSFQRDLRQKAAIDPPPAPTKTTPGPRIPLPPPHAVTRLARTLLARRTWRAFSKRALTRSQLSSLLQLTWGVQQQGRVADQGRIVLKTSPSAGARHPIEAYVLVLNVKGLRSGAYHYAATENQLVDLRRPVSKRLVTRLLANQDYFGESGAVVVMSAVVARTMWKYQHSRAYRAILAEAGHLAQTFCLVATALDLAPFCTMAFRDSEVERLLGIDGVSEVAIYVVGVGTRAHNVKYPGRVRPKKKVQRPVNSSR